MSNALQPTFVLRDVVELLRPHQWIKNIVVFAGPAAGLKLSDPFSLFKACIAFVSFCLAASAVYAINDTIDREADARHPTKCRRPIARGAITPGAAILAAVALVTLAFSLPAVMLNANVTVIIVLYFGMMLAYSLALKNRVILDVIILATGFVLRAIAGAEAVDVVASQWLIACVFTLCLFFGFGKRRCEITMIGNAESAGHHRATLLRYTPDLLTHLITVSGAVAIMTFLLYTMEVSRVPSLFHKEYLFYTLPIVVYGVFRYTMLTELGTHTGPTEIIIKDKMMVACIILWLVIALGIVYHDPVLSWLGWNDWLWGKV